MIAVVETLQAAQGKYDALKEALQALVPISRRAKGCVQYDLFEPMGNKDELLIFMRFKTLEDLRRHEESDYIAEFVKNCDRKLFTSFQVSEWREDGGIR